MSDREYVVRESYKITGETTVFAKSKQEAIEKVRAAFSTSDAYTFDWGDPHWNSVLTAERAD